MLVTINERVPFLEPEILKRPNEASEYAVRIMKERWPEAEKVLIENKADNIYPILDYAKNLIKGRWPEIEDILLRDHPAEYALICNERIPNVEKAILTNTKEHGYGIHTSEYVKNVVKGVWPELEKVLRSGAYPDVVDMCRYASDAGKATWPDIVKYIQHQEHADRYLTIVLQGRRCAALEKWYEEHPSYTSGIYIRSVKWEDNVNDFEIPPFIARRIRAALKKRSY
jgi:hypothetical protein